VPLNDLGMQENFEQAEKLGEGRRFNRIQRQMIQPKRFASVNEQQLT